MVHGVRLGWCVACVRRSHTLILLKDSKKGELECGRTSWARRETVHRRHGRETETHVAAGRGVRGRGGIFPISCILLGFDALRVKIPGGLRLIENS